MNKELAFEITQDLRTHLLSGFPEDKLPGYDQYFQEKIDSSISRLTDLVKLFYSSKTEHELLELKFKIETSISEIRTNRTVWDLETYNLSYFERKYKPVEYEYTWKQGADDWMRIYCDQDTIQKALIESLKKLLQLVVSEIDSSPYDSDIWEKYRTWLRTLDLNKARNYEAIVDPEKIKHKDYCIIVAVQMVEKIEGIQKTSIYHDLNDAIVHVYGLKYRMKITPKSFGDAVTKRQKKERRRKLKKR